MVTRIVLGAVMIAAVAGVLWLDWCLDQAVHDGSQWAAAVPPATPLAALLLPVVCIAFVELDRLAAANQVHVLRVSGLCGAVIFALMPFWLGEVVLPQDAQTVIAILAVIVLAVFAEQMIRRPVADALPNVATTLLAVMYLGLGAATILNIRYNWPNGTAVLVIFLGAVKGTDIGAYFVGSAIGKHKLSPRISPGKSWEGLVGGLAAGTGAAVLLTWLLPPTALTLATAAVFGVVVSIAGQFADLCESALKRSAGVKDSGRAVPGFGGVLDIIDSPLLAAPPAWLVLQFIAGQ